MHTWTASQPADHPRSRGEYLELHHTSQSWLGSSPLSRRIPEWNASARTADRIIPALAGNTPRRAATPCRRGGSSPLSRGIRAILVMGTPSLRIIPALAGNTYIGNLLIPRTRDHPRSRGEYRSPASGSSRRCGSSPLSRGIRSRAEGNHGGYRIIPALAGNTAMPHPLRPGPWDHPRSRGEYSRIPLRMRPKVGSSPLSRGIRHAERTH